MAEIIINGISISGGRTLVIRNNKILVDGKDVTPDAKEIRVTVNGDVEKLKTNACAGVEINGDVASLESHAGDVSIGGNVSGNVRTRAGTVDVDGNISGDVSVVAGSIRYRK